MLTLQKLWAVQWVWPIIAYVFALYSQIRTNLSYGHPLIPRRPDKRGLTVFKSIMQFCITIKAHESFQNEIHCRWKRVKISIFVERGTNSTMFYIMLNQQKFRYIKPSNTLTSHNTVIQEIFNQDFSCICNFHGF